MAQAPALPTGFELPLEPRLPRIGSVDQVAVEAMREVMDTVPMRGRVVIVGNRGAIEINPRSIMSKDAIVTGFTNWNATPKELVTAHAAVIAGMHRCGFRPEVGKEMPLAQAPKAHEEVMKPGAYGKIVLIP